MIAWATPALSEDAYKFVVHSVQALLLAAFTCACSVAIYFIDPWPRLAKFWPPKEVSEKELLAKGVPNLPPSPIDTGAAPKQNEAPEKKATAPSAKPWTTDVFPEKE